MPWGHRSLQHTPGAKHAALGCIQAPQDAAGAHVPTDPRTPLPLSHLGDSPRAVPVVPMESPAPCSHRRQLRRSPAVTCHSHTARDSAGDGACAGTPSGTGTAASHKGLGSPVPPQTCCDPTGRGTATNQALSYKMRTALTLRQCHRGDIRSRIHVAPPDPPWGWDKLGRGSGGTPRTPTTQLQPNRATPSVCPSPPLAFLPKTSSSPRSLLAAHRNGYKLIQIRIINAN